MTSGLPNITINKDRTDATAERWQRPRPSKVKTFLVGLPFIAICASVSGVATADTVKDLKPSADFIDEAIGLSFPVQHVTWTQIENSEGGDAIYTFQNTEEGFEAYVFRYEGRSLNNLAKNRYIEMLEWEPKVNCTEQQSFQPGTLFGRVEQVCLINRFGIEGGLSTFIETTDGTYELYINLYSTSGMKSQVVKSVKAAAKGFDIQ